MISPSHRSRMVPALLLGAALVFAGVRGVVSRDQDVKPIVAAATATPAGPAQLGGHVILLKGGATGVGVRP
jgi:hypothetical protein